MNNFAHLRTDSPFYDLFPDGLCPIKNILIPNQVECLGDGIQDVYMVDVNKLTAGQLEAILDRLTAQCPDLREEARRDIAQRGLPLRAKHVSGVSSDSPFFL